ncbi:MAG: phosphoribosylformylglycinamidine cyclo-ligase [Syntrophales bacterium]|nr:phosphoribosylformylglycinamidine cyclo-ligase [Syntrophales bacterium]
MKKKVSYKDAGVDINKANLFVKKIQPIIKGTSRKEVMSGIGNFGGLFHLDMGKFKDPILVSSTDGVGTKLKIAQMMDKHDTVGIDLVAMSVNDILSQGAEPLFFLDYIATGKIDVKKSVKIVEGIAKGCIEAGCALIGGETAEMPEFYKDDDYDLAGFCVGIVDASELIDGSEIKVGDRIIGIASNGIHSNGFSLVRKVLFEQKKLKIKDKIEGLGHSIGTELLRPTKIYVKPILNLMKTFKIKGVAHITGGGFIENIPRILPSRCRAIIKKDSWDIPPIFDIIQKMGNIDKKEMLRVFNMGIGMMIVVTEKDFEEVLERLGGLGERAYAIGTIDNRNKNEKHVSFL